MNEADIKAWEINQSRLNHLYGELQPGGYDITVRIHPGQDARKVLEKAAYYYSNRANNVDDLYKLARFQKALFGGMQPREANLKFLATTAGQPSPDTPEDKNNGN